MKSAKKSARQSAASGGPTGRKPKGFTDEERAAMREHVEEQKAQARGHGGQPDGEGAVLGKIAALKQPDRAIGERLHAIIRTHAPGLSPKTWYGMPAYAKDEKVVCFFQSSQKFRTRYSTLGFSDQASLDDGSMWPTAFALKQLTGAEEVRIIALIKKAVS